MTSSCGTENQEQADPVTRNLRDQYTHHVELQDEDEEDHPPESAVSVTDPTSLSTTGDAVPPCTPSAVTAPLDILEAGAAACAPPPVRDLLGSRREPRWTFSRVTGRLVPAHLRASGFGGGGAAPPGLSDGAVWPTRVGPARRSATPPGAASTWTPPGPGSRLPSPPSLVVERLGSMADGESSDGESSPPSAAPPRPCGCRVPGACLPVPTVEWQVSPVGVGSSVGGFSALCCSACMLRQGLQEWHKGRELPPWHSGQVWHESRAVGLSGGAFTGGGRECSIGCGRGGGLTVVLGLDERRPKPAEVRLATVAS